MYVAIEGVDCMGKSTQISLLKQVFKNAIFTMEPGATPLGLSLRQILLNKPFSLCKKAEFLLFLADRAQHYDELLSKHKNELIISDRSLISGIAYAKDFDKEFQFELNSFALDGFFPQKVIFLKGDAELIKHRLSKKELDSIEKRGVEYFLSIQNALEKSIDFLQKKLKFQTLVLNADESIENLHEKIKDFIND